MALKSGVQRLTQFVFIMNLSQPICDGCLQILYCVNSHRQWNANNFGCCRLF